MPSINKLATATAKVISADQGITFYNPGTRQIEKVVPGQDIPVNAVLEFSQPAKLELSLDGQTVIIEGAAGTGQPVAKSFGLEVATTDDDIPVDYQPLPSLKKTGELTSADLKPARTGGFRQPVIENITVTEEPRAYDLVLDDLRRPDAMAGIPEAFEEKPGIVKGPAIPAQPQAVFLPPVTPTPPQPETPVIAGIRQDTGASDKDLITNSTEFDIFGTSPGNTTVDLLLEGVVIHANIPVDSNGEWSGHWQAPAATEDQSFSFTARAVRDGVASQPSDPVLVHVKTSKPELSLASEPVSTATTVFSDIQGKTRDVHKVTLKFQGLQETINTESDGAFTFGLDLRDESILKLFSPDIDTKMTAGVYQVIVEDIAGNITTSADQTLRVPLTPTNITIEPDTGYLGADRVTNSHEVAIHGDSLIGTDMPVSVQVNDLEPVMATLDKATGRWQTEPFDLKEDGKYHITAWYGSPDKSGDPVLMETSFEINSAAPEFSDDNFLSEPVYSNANPPVLDVGTKAGNRVHAELLDSGGNVVSKASGQAASTAHLTFAPVIDEGIYTLKVVLVNLAGNKASRQQEWHADFTSPEAPSLELVIDDTEVVDDTNYVQSAVKVLATAETGTSLRFVDDKDNVLKPVADAATDGPGRVYTFSFSEPGLYGVLARCTDRAGNESNYSDTVRFEVLTAAPAVDLVTVPQDTVFLKATDVARVQVVFDQKVRLTSPEQLKLVLQLDADKKVEAGFSEQSADGKTISFSYTVDQSDSAAKGIIVPADALVNSTNIEGLSGITLDSSTVETQIPTLVIDNIAPEAPELTHLSTSTADHPSFSTNATKFDLMGRSEAGSGIQLYNADTDEKLGEPFLTLTDGNWQFPLSTSASALTTLRVYATARDSADNESPKSGIVTIVSDPVRPEIDSISGAAEATEYRNGDEVVVAVRFSKPVIVSGSPRLGLLIGANRVEAALDKSSVSPDTLVFKYLVSPYTPDSGELSVAPGALVLSDKDSIQDSFNNSVITEIKQPYALNDRVIIDPVIAETPVITEITPLKPAGLYTSGDTLPFRVVFNKAVSLDGRDVKLLIQLDGEKVPVPLSESSELENTGSLLFDYEVAAGQNAPDGITVIQLQRNGTTVAGPSGLQYIETALNQSLDTHRIDTTAPVLEKAGLAEGSAEHFALGQTIEVGLGFSEPVRVTAANGQLPQIVLSIGGKPHTLTLAACTEAKANHTVSYTVAEGDAGPLSLAPLTLNGASITDAAGLEADLSPCVVADLSGYAVEAPAILAEPVRVIDIVHAGDLTDYKTGDRVKVRVTFSGPVLIEAGAFLRASVNGEDKFMRRNKRAEAADTEFVYNMKASDKMLSADGFTIGEFKSDAGTKITAAEEGRTVDLTLPRVFHIEGVTFNLGAEEAPDIVAPVLEKTGLVEGSAKYFTLGKAIEVELSFSEPVRVTVANGQLPQIVLNIGDQPHTLILPPCTEPAATHRISYTLVEGDAGPLYLAPLTLNGASITDEAGLEVDLSACAIADLSSYLVDTSFPAIEDVTLASGLYKTGDALELRVSFNKAMSLDKSGGVPALALDIGDQHVEVPLAADGVLVDGRQLDFRHVLKEGDNGVVTVRAFKLAGAVLSDGAGQSFDDNSYKGTALENVLADTIAPVLEKTGLVEGSAEHFTLGKTIEVGLSFSEPVRVTAANGQLPQIILNIGDKPHTLTLPACTEARANHTISYTVAEGDAGPLSLAPLTLNGASITDEAGLEADLSPCVVADLSGYLVEVAPIAAEPVRVIDIVHAGQQTDYQTGDRVRVRVIFSGPVLIDTKAFLKASVNGEDKFMRRNRNAEAADTEFIYNMRASDKMISADGFTIDRFKSDADTKITAAEEGRTVDLTLPRTFHIEGVTFNADQIIPEQTVQQPLPVQEPVKPLTPPAITVDRKEGVYKAGDTISVKLAFDSPVTVIAGQNPATAQLQIGSQVVTANLQTGDGTTSELVFTCAVSAGLKDDDGITLESINGGDSRITDAGSGEVFEPGSLGQQAFTVNVDSVMPVVTAFVPEDAVKTRYSVGETFSIEVKLSKAVHAGTSTGAGKPYLELELGEKTVQAPMDEGRCSDQSLIFTFEITDRSLLATEGIRVSSVNLNGAHYEDSAGNPLDVEGVSSRPLNLFVVSPYPSLVSADGALISDDAIMVPRGKPALKFEVPAGVDNIACHPCKEIAAGTWSKPTSSSPAVLEEDGKTLLQINLFKRPFPKWLFPYKCSVETEDGTTMAQLYKVGIMMPSHHYNFDALWPKDAQPQAVQSLSYPGERTNAIVAGQAGTDISQVASPFSTGHALQLNGGSLKLDDMSDVFRGDFTVCSWIATTAGNDSDKPWLSPSLIGRENPKRTDDMFLFSLNKEGHTGIVLGDRYGAISSEPVNDGQLRYVCLSRELQKDEDGTASKTRIFINGAPDGDPFTIYHKGHTAIQSIWKTWKAPEPGLAVDLDTIGQTTSNDPNDSPVPFPATIDDLEITPFAMDDQQQADAYTWHLNMPMAAGDYDPVGLFAAITRPQLTSAGQVRVTFSHGMKEEAAVKGGAEINEPKEVKGQAVEFECEFNGKTATYTLDATFDLNSPNADNLSSFRCKATDTEITAYRIMFDNPEQSPVPEAMLLVGNPLRSGLYFDGIAHNGLAQAGNSPLEPKATPDFFIAEDSAVLDNVGPEDFIVLDEMPELRELLGKENPVEVASALNELVHCTHSVVRPDTAGQATEGDTPVSLTVNTIAPDQPVSAYLAGELYTINPDHIV